MILSVLARARARKRSERVFARARITLARM
jgi:hypothetical protein